MYNKKILQIFKNPKNMGKLKNPDGIGKVSNPYCGDTMWAYIKVGKQNSKEVIKDVKVKTFGCVAAIVTSSVMTELVKGKPLEQAGKISPKDVENYLGQLPTPKRHCSNLAADALQAAIEDYKNRKSKK